MHPHPYFCKEIITCRYALLRDIINSMRKYNKNKGFTLIELSIVLIVIGLIVSTITAGGSMIHSAELKSLISDYK